MVKKTLRALVWVEVSREELVFWCSFGSNGSLLVRLIGRGHSRSQTAAAVPLTGRRSEWHFDDDDEDLKPVFGAGGGGGGAAWFNRFVLLACLLRQLLPHWRLHAALSQWWWWRLRSPLTNIYYCFGHQLPNYEPITEPRLPAHNPHWWWWSCVSKLFSPKEQTQTMPKKKKTKTLEPNSLMGKKKTTAFLLINDIMNAAKRPLAAVAAAIGPRPLNRTRPKGFATPTDWTESKRCESGPVVPRPRWIRCDRRVGMVQNTAGRDWSLRYCKA